MNNLQQFDLVLFGATGDLVTRKLLPALYNAYCNNTIHPNARIFTIGRKDILQEEFCTFAYTKALNAKQNIDEVLWKKFCNLIHYINLDILNADDYIRLRQVLNTQIINIYFLSIDQGLFKLVCQHLAAHELNHPNARIVLEKPLGHNLSTSNDINNYVAQFFQEHQIYRIDHYLGKESVQNLLAIRFGNTLFEALWRRQWISNIQITIAEQIGVESRGGFYDKTGALRDMLQNHLLQLLCIVAMEPPASLEADVIRNEKLKVLQSLKPLTEDMVRNNVVCGQYKSGMINNTKVSGYLEEENIQQNSKTDTYVAMKAEIQNWRWAGVPFYLRTGKRLHQQMAEIVIQFKDIPCAIFPFNTNNYANRLIIKLQPNEMVQLYFLAKQPGDTNDLKPVFLDLDFHKTFTSRRTEGYERLLLDIIRGNLTLFVRRDEQEAAWKWVDPILNTWQSLNMSPELYNAGTWGPVGASKLLARENASWHEELM